MFAREIKRGITWSNSRQMYGSRGRGENIENQRGIPAQDEEGTSLFPKISAILLTIYPGFANTSKPLNA